MKRDATEVFLFMLMAAALVAVLAISGCATAPTPAEPAVKIVETKVPVATSCVPADVKKAPGSYADAAITVDTPGPERFRLTAKANEQRKSRLAVVEPVIAGC